ncbi:FHA domain-containing protein, partial [Streptomyces sp. ISL-66]|uniref:FHA domain-containing protein n=1 Tax=Streptomyces sp. ISL-66 TaxID=2819186 RepID=UPI0027E3D898
MDPCRAHTPRTAQKGPLTAMQIRLTVLGSGPRSGHHPAATSTTSAAPASCDVLVTAPAGTALSAVASGLAATVGGPDTGGTVVLYAGTERLDPARCALGEPPLVDGAVLSLHLPGPDVLADAGPGDVPRLHVVAGPDAGGVHLLHPGAIRIGRSADADVPLDDLDVSRLHCAVTVMPDGRVAVADLGSTNGTTLDGAVVGAAPVPLAPGALLRIGESTLRLASGPTPRPRPLTPDLEGHLSLTLADDTWTATPDEDPDADGTAPSGPRTGSGAGSSPSGTGSGAGSRPGRTDGSGAGTGGSGAGYSPGGTGSGAGSRPDADPWSGVNHGVSRGNGPGTGVSHGGAPGTGGAGAVPGSRSAAGSGASQDGQGSDGGYGDQGGQTGPGNHGNHGSHGSHASHGSHGNRDGQAGQTGSLGGARGPGAGPGSASGPWPEASPRRPGGSPGGAHGAATTGTGATGAPSGTDTGGNRAGTGDFGQVSHPGVNPGSHPAADPWSGVSHGGPAAAPGEARRTGTGPQGPFPHQASSRSGGLAPDPQRPAAQHGGAGRDAPGAGPLGSGGSDAERPGTGRHRSTG